MSTVIGLEKVDYTSRRTGNRVTGTRVYYSFKSKNIIDGMAVDNVYLRADVIPPSVGNEVMFIFDNRRNCIGWQ